MTIAFTWAVRNWVPPRRREPTRAQRVVENLEAELARIDRQMAHSHGLKFQQLSARYAEAEEALDFAHHAFR